MPANYSYLKNRPNTGGVKPPKTGLKMGLQGYKMKQGIGPAKNPLKGGLVGKGQQKPPIQTLNDSGYNADVAGINRDYADAMTGLDARKYATESQYGYGAEFAANPYTRANLLSSAYNRAFNQTGNSYASQGQLYSGALDRARAFGADNYQRQNYELRGEYDRELMGLEADRMSAERARATGQDKAYADMLSRYLEKDPDTTLYPAGEKGDKGGSGKGGKKKKPGVKGGIGPYEPKAKMGGSFKRGQRLKFGLRKAK